MMKFNSFLLFLLVFLIGFSPLLKSAAPILVPAITAAVPAVASTVVAATSIPAAIGVGLGTAVAVPVAAMGTFAGFIAFENNRCFPGGGIFAVATALIGAIATIGTGVIASPFIASSLTTGKMPGFVAIAADTSLKCACLGWAWAKAENDYQKELPKALIGASVISGLAAALWCGCSR